MVNLIYKLQMNIAYFQKTYFCNLFCNAKEKSIKTKFDGIENAMHPQSLWRLSTNPLTRHIKTRTIHKYPTCTHQFHNFTVISLLLRIHETCGVGVRVLAGICERN